jgi:glycyl-tRNA synthetase (class II)
MKLAKRFFFYFGGFAIGIFLLYFFVAGSGASCDYDYGPNARTLKNIRIKERVYSEETLINLSNYELDTSAISILLQNGNVLFSESNTRLDSCKVYVIEGVISKKNLKISVQNCEKTATIRSAEIK